MAAHWRMAFTTAKATEGEGRIEGGQSQLLSFPKLRALSNGDPSFSLDWVYGHHGNLSSNDLITQGRPLRRGGVNLEAPSWKQQLAVASFLAFLVQLVV